MRPIDCLVIGAGPAGLAAAIRFKQQQKDASVVVVEKASCLGGHSLSGAVVELACLEELLPGWRDFEDSLLPEMVDVVRDEMYFLTKNHAWQIPPALVPSGMHHAGDQMVPLSKLVAWLGRQAIRLGVETYFGFSARAFVWEGGVIKGVKLVDQGRGKDGRLGENYLPGEEILATMTIVADGAGGVLGLEYAARIGGNVNPQVYSIGLKQVFRLPTPHAFGAGCVVNTLGFPSRQDVFGGGFIYGMAHDLLAVGLILGLDWRYTDLSPQMELEIFKGHPFVAEALKGAQLLEAGAKIIPEGGFYALPKVWHAGALLIGDAAGFVNMRKFKGVHYGILSGMAAADAAVDGDLSSYPSRLAERRVLRDMRSARNFRAVFQGGLYLGAPLSQVQQFIPWRIGAGRDRQAMRAGARLGRRVKPALDRAAFAALSGTMHREDQPAHLIIADPALCERCAREFQSPCTVFCPTEVYRRKDPLSSVHISAVNCVHCGTCAVKCPLANIRWTPPEGGGGPRYKMM